MTEQKPLTITILGKNYSIVTDEDDAIIKEAAALIDSLMQKAMTKTETPVEAAKKTTFVALQLAVDLIKERQNFSSVCSKTSTLNNLLKEALPE